jgi:hypothetical protein
MILKVWVQKLLKQRSTWYFHWQVGFVIAGVTASLERDFSAMKIIKYKLLKKMNDDWFNHLMICYIKQKIFKSFDDVVII